MSNDLAPLVVATSRGVYCPPGDFYIDPVRPVQTAVITHGHGDHLRRGHARYILARPGLAIARSRLKGRPDILALEYAAPAMLRSVRVSLHPAGHILGSAQVRLEHEGRVWVVSGDYKRQPDPTCEAFAPLPCDVFVSEATFGQPEFRWPPTHEVIAEILAWWRENRERGIASVLFCYALGKAQRLLAELAAHALPAAIQVHGSMGELVRLYRESGVRMAPTITATTENLSLLRGSLVLVPPHVRGTPWMRRIGPHTSALVSGWMQRVRGGSEMRRPGYERGFTLSDHADWPALVETCLETRARRVLLMHGSVEALAGHLRERGIDAAALEPGPQTSLALQG
jgi:putative mRNA 3-end processing factor